MAVKEVMSAFSTKKGRKKKRKRKKKKKKTAYGHRPLMWISNLCKIYTNNLQFIHDVQVKIFFTIQFFKERDAS